MKNQFSGNHPTAAKLLCESRGWELFDLGDEYAIPWRRFKLVVKTKQRKANYWFSFNGQRLAMGKDAVLLNTHFPDVFDWVVESLKQAGQ